MAFLLIPIFALSLAYSILGVFQVSEKPRLCLIVSLGIFVMGISFPMVIFLLNGFAGGFIENQLSILWSADHLLMIGNGDIYIGAVSFQLLLWSHRYY